MSDPKDAPPQPDFRGLTTALAGSFRPTQLQAQAKARLYRWLDTRGGIVSAEHLTRDELVRACGTKKVLTWMQEQSDFLIWLLERDSFAIEVRASRARAFEVLMEILDSPLNEPKDRLKAAQMLLELDGAFPSRSAPPAAPAPTGDPEVDELPDADVQRELVEARKRLGKADDGSPEQD